MTIKDDSISDISIHIPSTSQIPSSVTPSPTAPISITPVSSISEYSNQPRRSHRMSNRSSSSLQIQNPIPSITVQQNKKKVPLKHINFSWKPITYLNFSIESPIEQEYIMSDNILTPMDYFMHFFSNDVINLLVEQSNLYSMQKYSKPLSTTSNEIKDFLSIQLWMGIVKMPSYVDYWAAKSRYAPIADIMSLKKYQKILRSLHLTNNDEVNNSDRFFKVRPYIELIRQNCLKLSQGTRFSIDEMMVPYKGKKAGSRRQYMKNKPKKWGFKLFVRAGVDGMVYDFFPYSGENTFQDIQFSEYENSYFGLGPKVVIALCKSIPNKPLSIIYFDNFFTTPELIYYLRHGYGILSLGTLRKQHLRGCDINDKELSKMPRGSFISQCDPKHKVVIVKWLDNKIVSLASSYAAEEPILSIQRYSKTAKEKVPVPYPKIIQEYNTHMGGVDLADMLIALYRTNMKTHKWYMAIFSQMLDLSVNNAWLLYRRDCKNEKKIKRLKEFRQDIAAALALKNKSRVGRPSTSLEKPVKKHKFIVNPRPPQEIIEDRFDHCPAFTTKGRCRFCKKGQTSVICLKCKTRLCFVEGRNCFKNYHYTK